MVDYLCLVRLIVSVVHLDLTGMWLGAAPTTVTRKWHVLKFSKRNKTMGLILFQRIFLWRACYLVVFLQHVLKVWWSLWDFLFPPIKLWVDFRILNRVCTWDTFCLKPYVLNPKLIYARLAWPTRSTTHVTQIKYEHIKYTMASTIWFYEGPIALFFPCGGCNLVTLCN